MIYATILSVVAAALIGGVVRVVGIAGTTTMRNSGTLRARAAADISVAIVRDLAARSAITLPYTISRTVGNATISGTAALVTAGSSLVKIDQTVVINGRSFYFQDYASMPSAGKTMNWAGVAYASDNFGGNQANLTSTPNFTTAVMSKSFSTAITVTATGFRTATTYTAAQVASMRTALGLTAAQFDSYEILAFMVKDSSSAAAWDYSTLEVSRGLNRIVAALSGTTGINKINVPYTTYKTAFASGTEPFGANTVVTAVLIDVDAFTGGTNIKTSTDPLNITFYGNDSSNREPPIDAVAWMGSSEAAQNNGFLAEFGIQVGIADTAESATTIPFVNHRRIEPTPGRPNQAAANWSVAGTAYPKWATYRGSFIAPVSGTYSFRMQHDNSARMWVDNTFVTGNWKWSTGTSNSGSVNLTSGQNVPIYVEYEEGGGLEVLSLQWSYPGQSWQEIPNNMVTPGAPTNLVYFNDFEGGSAASWTWNDIRNSGHGNGPQGNQVPVNGVANFPGYGKILGDFSNIGNGGNSSYAQLTLTNVAAGKLVLYGDLIFLYSWDGDWGWGPDRLRVKANGTTLLDISPQDIPNPLITNGAITSRYYTTGCAYYGQRLGASYSGCGLVENSRLEWQHPGGDLVLRFEGYGEDAQYQSGGLQWLNDESWALDNICVRRLGP